MLRKTTRREKRAAARLTKMMRRSLGKWGRAERPSRALPDVSTLDRQATEVNNTKTRSRVLGVLRTEISQ